MKLAVYFFYKCTQVWQMQAAKNTLLAYSSEGSQTQSLFPLHTQQSVVAKRRGQRVQARPEHLAP